MRSQHLMRSVATATLIAFAACVLLPGTSVARDFSYIKPLELPEENNPFPIILAAVTLALVVGLVASGLDKPEHRPAPDGVWPSSEESTESPAAADSTRQDVDSTTTAPGREGISKLSLYLEVQPAGQVAFVGPSLYRSDYDLKLGVAFGF